MATASKVIINLQKLSPRISKIIDVSSVFTASGAQAYIQDLTGWDSCVVQIMSPSAAIAFNTTNDNGSVTGTLPPVPQVPANWLAVQGVNIGTGASVTSTAVSANVKFTNFGKFLQII